jgi:murein L,D-transpeptidase YcbB/YkuD
VPILRERLSVHAVKRDDILYDKALYNAMRNLQRRRGVKPTGLIDLQVLAASSGPKPSQMPTPSPPI